MAACWKILGIARTDDARAVKRAYSARLKTIDPDTDPQAFIALREAFEQAQLHISKAAARAPEPQPEATEAAPQPAELNAIEQHAQAIMALLYGEEAVDEAELQRHWHALSTDPRLEEVSLFDQVQQWAARVIAETAPRSLPLIIPATEFFGWTADEGTVAQSPVLAWIVHRYHDLRFLDAAREEGHTHHAAWLELTTPAPPGARRGSIGPRPLFELLEVIRRARPDLEAQLDSDRVALWDRLDRLEADDGSHEQGSGYSRPGCISAGIFAIYIFMMAARACTPQAEQTPPPTYYVPPPRQDTEEPFLLPPPRDLMEDKPKTGNPMSAPRRPTPTSTPFIPGAPR